MSLTYLSCESSSSIRTPSSYQNVNAKPLNTFLLANAEKKKQSRRHAQLLELLNSNCPRPELIFKGSPFPVLRQRVA